MSGYKRIIGLLLTAALLFAAGCGQDAGAVTEGAREEKAPDTAVEGAGTEVSDPGETTAGADGETAMGRYVETIYQLPADHSRIGSIARMEDGSLRLFDFNNGLWVSGDEGATWEPESTAWCERLVTRDTYILDVAIAPDGFVAVAYAPQKEQAPAEDGAGSGDEEQAAGEDRDAQTDKGKEGDARQTEPEKEDTVTQTDAAKEDGASEETVTAADAYTDSFSLQVEYLLIAPDGTEKELTLPAEESSYVQAFCFSDTGALFASAISGSFYEIDRTTGEGTLLFTNDGYGHNMAVRGDLMVYTYQGGFGLYDLAKEESLEDETLEEFVSSVLGGRLDNSMEGSVAAALFLQEDNVLYLVCGQGIYRHAVGGSRMEQIMDGAITSLGNPVNSIADMTMLEDDRFLVAFNGGRLMLYSYDPEIPTVPQLAVKVYSLRENDMLKQAIALYQNRHPESYVQYETGIISGSPVTREDALKKLNTEIVAGKGPDLLLLDDMPVASYMEKGILADLTPYLKDTADSLLPAAVRAFSSGEAVYAVPAQFLIPLLAGDKKVTDRITDLASLAEQLEILRKEKPQGSLLGGNTEETLLTTLLPVCAPAWKTEDGALDREALQEFLTLAERIWKAESAGYTAEMREKQEERAQRLLSMENNGLGVTTESWLQSMNLSKAGWQMGEQKLVTGQLDSSWNLADLVSTFRLEGFDGSDFRDMNGQVSHAYTPVTVMGIRAGSSRADAAGELLQLLLNSKEISWYNGLPMNRDCLAQEAVNTYTDGDHLGSVSSSNEEGTMFSMELYWPTEADFAKLWGFAEQLAVPYIRDDVLEDAAVKNGQKVLTGELSPEEGVRAIEKETAIYLAE